MSDPTLTPGELDALRLVAYGVGVPSSRRGQLTSLRKKLGAETLAHAVAIAYELGLLPGQP